MKKYLFLLATAILAVPVHGQAQIGNSGGHNWQVKPGEKSIEFHFGGELVTSYNIDPKYPKPCFYPLIGPTGENIVRAYPMEEAAPGEDKDHVHHRGLWFGLGKVNGIDFWHEPGSGKDSIYGKMVNTQVKGVELKGADKSATLNVTTDWTSSEDDKKICQDKRRIRLQRLDDGSTLIDFDITIEATEGDVMIKDDKEGALAIRVQPTLRLEPPKKAEKNIAQGSIINSAGDEGRDAWGKRANWVDYYGPDNAGNKIGVAFFYHPSNMRAPTWWHARYYGLFACNPFGQGNFEKDAGEGAGDYTIKNGESLTLRFRLILHKGTPEEAKVNAAFETYGKE